MWTGDQLFCSQLSPNNHYKVPYYTLEVTYISQHIIVSAPHWEEVGFSNSYLPASWSCLTILPITQNFPSFIPFRQVSSLLPYVTWVPIVVCLGKKPKNHAKFSIYVTFVAHFPLPTLIFIWTSRWTIYSNRLSSATCLSCSSPLALTTHQRRKIFKFWTIVVESLSLFFK